MSIYCFKEKYTNKFRKIGIIKLSTSETGIIYDKLILAKLKQNYSKYPTECWVNYHIFVDKSQGPTSFFLSLQSLHGPCLWHTHHDVHSNRYVKLNINFKLFQGEDKRCFEVDCCCSYLNACLEDKRLLTAATMKSSHWEKLQEAYLMGIDGLLLLLTYKEMSYKEMSFLGIKRIYNKHCCGDLQWLLDFTWFK